MYFLSATRFGVFFLELFFVYGRTVLPVVKIESEVSTFSVIEPIIFKNKYFFFK